MLCNILSVYNFEDAKPRNLIIEFNVDEQFIVATRYSLLINYLVYSTADSVG